MFQTVSLPPSPVVRLDHPLLSRQKLGQLGVRLTILLLAAGGGFWIGRSHDAAADPPARHDAPRPQDADARFHAMVTRYAPPPAHGPLRARARIVDFQTRLDARSGQLTYGLAAESDGTPYRGQLSFEIAGLRNGHLDVLLAPGPEAAVASPQRLQLSFSRYVRTEGAVRLPPGFTPLFVGASLPSPRAGTLRKLTCPS